MWNADDATSLGKFDQIRTCRWWDQLVKLGPGYGYYPNAVKANWLATKEEHIHMATDTFKGTGAKVTSHGRQYLGAPIGNRAFTESFVKKNWVSELDCLATFAKTQPHAAHSAFIHGLTCTSEWSLQCKDDPRFEFTLPATGGCHQNEIDSRANRQTSTK